MQNISFMDHKKWLARDAEIFQMNHFMRQEKSYRCCCYQSQSVSCSCHQPAETVYHWIPLNMALQRAIKTHIKGLTQSASEPYLTFF